MLLQHLFYFVLLHMKQYHNISIDCIMLNEFKLKTIFQLQPETK